MSDEQHGTLTLDALLGTPGEAPAYTSSSDGHLLEQASDLLLDLMGVVPDPPKAPLTLDTLPALPKIPLQASAAAPESQPGSSSEEAPAILPEVESAKASLIDTSSSSVADEMPEKRTTLEPDGPAKPSVAPATRFARKGKHASGRVKDRTLGGKHAVRVAEQPPSGPRAEPDQNARVLVAKPEPQSVAKRQGVPEPVRGPEPKPEPEPEPESEPKPESKPVRGPKPEPEPGPKFKPSPSSLGPRPAPSASSRLERLNELSKKIEAEIIAASGQRDCVAERRPVSSAAFEWSCDESPMFEERPQSIAENMKEVQRRHSQLVRIKIALGIVGALLLVALALAVAQQCFGPGEADEAAQGVQTTSFIAPDVPDAPDQDQSQPVLNEEPNEVENTGQSSPQQQTEDKSGTVVYRYVTMDSSGEGHAITETVVFAASGLCETSILDVEFADGEGAAAFAESLHRDYGSAARVVDVNGAAVHAEIDASSNGLDREAYEDALRESVRDLSIVRKS